MDRVFIRGLQVSTIIGAYEWERQVEQILIVDAEMASHISKAAENDDLNLALNYSAVGERITSFVSEGQFKLVETVAHRLADVLMSEFSLTWLKLEVQKPRPFSGGHVVGVAVERDARA